MVKLIELAESIFEVIKDYRNDDGIQLTIENIIDWGKQFDNDAEFILTELNHIISKTYLSKQNAKKCIRLHIKKLMGVYKYDSPAKFLIDTLFLDMQDNNKTQKHILGLREDILQDEYNESYRAYLSYPKSNFI